MVIRNSRLQGRITKKSVVKHLPDGTVGHIVEASNDEAYLREIGRMAGATLGERTTESLPGGVGGVKRRWRSK